jgi:hypothetical protein
MPLIQAKFSIQAGTMDEILRKIYDFSESDNAFIIKLSPDSYLDLFNKLDHNPIRKKDLNQSVINYIEDCSDDISLDKNIILEIKIKKVAHSSDLESRVRNGLLNYFEYMVEYYRQKMKKQRSTSLLFVVLFILLATSSLKFASLTVDSKNVLFKTLVQGISIGSWVFLWEAIVGITIKYKPNRMHFRFYKRLLNAKIIFINAAKQKNRLRQSSRPGQRQSLKSTRKPL